MKPYDVMARTEQRAQFAHTAQVSDWYKITALAATRSAKVYIYDAIGGWFGLDTGEFVREINALDVDEIELHINSPGGSVFDGMAVYNALRQHKAPVHTVVDGIAASMASVIALAGDSVTMSGGSFMMIHDASGICLGNASDMVETAGLLDKLSGSMSAIYAKKGGGDAETWREAMRAETWYSAEEAVDAGLADTVDKDAADDDADATKAAFDLSIFAYAGRAEAPAPVATARLHKGEYVVPAASVRTYANGGVISGGGGPKDDRINPQLPAASSVASPIPTSKEGSPTMDSLTTGLRERLGIPADADLDEAGLLTALDETLAEQTIEPVAQAVPEGAVVIDAAILEQLRTDASAGVAARARQIEDDNTALVDTAVAEGRIAPARRDHWIASLKADPGSAQVLASMAPGLIPLAPKGYTGGVEEAPDDDRVYQAAWPTEGN